MGGSVVESLWQGFLNSDDAYELGLTLRLLQIESTDDSHFTMASIGATIELKSLGVLIPLDVKMETRSESTP